MSHQLRRTFIAGLTASLAGCASLSDEFTDGTSGTTDLPQTMPDNVETAKPVTTSGAATALHTETASGKSVTTTDETSPAIETRADTGTATSRPTTPRSETRVAPTSPTQESQTPPQTTPATESTTVQSSPTKAPTTPPPTPPKHRRTPTDRLEHDRDLAVLINGHGPWKAELNLVGREKRYVDSNTKIITIPAETRWVGAWAQNIEYPEKPIHIGLYMNGELVEHNTGYGDVHLPDIWLRKIGATPDRDLPTETPPENATSSPATDASTPTDTQPSTSAPDTTAGQTPPPTSPETETQSNAFPPDVATPTNNPEGRDLQVLVYVEENVQWRAEVSHTKSYEYHGTGARRIPIVDDLAEQVRVHVSTARNTSPTIHVGLYIDGERFKAKRNPSGVFDENFNIYDACKTTVGTPESTPPNSTITNRCAWIEKHTTNEPQNPHGG